MSPQLPELELTENMVIEDPERVIRLLAELKKMGVRLMHFLRYGAISKIINTQVFRMWPNDGDC